MNVVDVSNLANCLSGHWVHDQLNFRVRQGDIVAIVGGSGAGKTTLLRSILLLNRPTKGSIKVFGQELIGAKHDLIQSVRRRWGVLFQQSALFSSLTVMENIVFPLKEIIFIST